jgi:ABC-type antimicrobial peptide transport system permease subunit
MVLGESLRLVGLGSLLGIPAAAGLARAIRSQLYGVSAVDPLTYLAAIAALLLVTTVAAYVPARRAAHLEPMSALREA